VKKLPAEIVASLLAVTTVIISLPPYHPPPWAIFIAWAGTFAAGGPTPAVLKKIWPVMPVGSLFAFLIALAFAQASHYFAGVQFVIAQMVILFCLNTLLLFTARIPGLGFIPGMFFGFASYFATFFGGFGPVPHDPLAALFAAILMNAFGPAYAWMNVKFAAPHGPRAESRSTGNGTTATPNAPLRMERHG
jgi:hypothetical protein